MTIHVFGSGRRGWRWGEWMRELGLGFTNPVGTGGSVGHVSVFWLRWCGWCRWGVGRGLGPGSGAVGQCYIWIFCVDGRSRYLCIVLGRYLHI